MSWKYITRHTIESNVCVEKDDLSISQKKVRTINEAERIFFLEKDIDIFNGISNKITIYKNILRKGVRFTSTESCDEKTTKNYFVRMKDDRIGSVKFYFIFKSHIYALINIYGAVDIFDHHMKIKRTESIDIVKFVDIVTKMIFLKFGAQEFVTLPPNNFEGT